MHKSNHLDELMVDIRFWIKNKQQNLYPFMLLSLYSLLLPNVIYVWKNLLGKKGVFSTKDKFLRV